MIDFYPDATAPLPALESSISFLRNLSGNYLSPDPPVQERLAAVLEGVERAVGKWAFKSDPSVKVDTIFVAPGLPDALSQLGELWPGRAPPVKARVLSPFFDRDNGNADRPTSVLWDLLRKRGRARVEFHVTGEDANDADDALLLHAPESLQSAMPSGRSDIATDFRLVEPEDGRPLHAKSIWLRSDRWYLYLLGSSNFTSRGLGLGANKRGGINLEANLVYWVNHQKYSQTARKLRQTFLEGSHIPAARAIMWLPCEEAGEDAPDDAALPLPAGFVSATYRFDQGNAVIALALEQPPAGWQVIDDATDRPVYSAEAWQAVGKPARVDIPWRHTRPPSGFWVTWEGAVSRAWWPVNIEAADALPPPEELKDLPLDVLINILTSARPLHRNLALRRYLKQQQGDEANGTSDTVRDLDPHRRVDTRRFLLQRTRRIGWALTALRERLERPVYSPKSLAWRLYGPVGVKALSEALIREACSDEEKAFLVAELALELIRVEPGEADGALPVQEVTTAVRSVAMELQSTKLPKLKHDDPLGNYVKRVFDLVAEG